MTASGSLNKILLTHWDVLERQSASPAGTKTINGHNLDIATVVLVARHNSLVGISDDARRNIGASARVLEVKTASEEVIYGINTGFGGNADTRTKAVDALKKDLLRGLQYGIIAEDTPINLSLCDSKKHQRTFSSTPALSLDHDAKSVMPESWVRASMLVRLNSLAHGASGILPSTVDALLRLLHKDVIPRVPLRGSISASGDLSPLAYVAGVLEGKPSLKAYVGDREKAERHVKQADVALSEQSIAPIVLKAREGLALVNGTSVSAAVAALAMHEALCSIALSQILTAMSVEALRGTDESFDRFLAAVRPHWGQAESSRNIHAYLKQSRLVDRDGGSRESSLRQDRYSIRTASQWLGPALEDLALANDQITTELNSATDNPLIDSNTSPARVLHGGNFQAKAVTSAVEKIRQSAQSIGRLLFTQCTELINPTTSRGLPPNLVAAEPSESFIFKGTDILIASLLSELGFLANPVGSHVQTAEMGNQGVNSLALISARYTIDALDILSQLAAAHLVALCQALDLRALQARFLVSLEPGFDVSLKRYLYAQLKTPTKFDALRNTCWKAFTTRLENTTTLDSTIRIHGAVSSIQAFIIPSLEPRAEAFKALMNWTDFFGKHAVDSFKVARDQYIMSPDATPLLGRASKRMYALVRTKLKVPFIGLETLATRKPGGKFEKGVTMGELNSKVRTAMMTGELYKAVVECIKDADREEPSNTQALAKL
ncbi:MAG: hypothetical protein Q9191_003428 [Dirinaria sp. TL-2023a]